MKYLLTIVLLAFYSFQAQAGRFIEPDYDGTGGLPSLSVVVGFFIICLVVYFFYGVWREYTRPKNAIDIMVGNCTKGESDNYKAAHILNAIGHEYAETFPYLADDYNACFEAEDMRSFQHAITRHFIEKHKITTEDVLFELVERACFYYGHSVEL